VCVQPGLVTAQVATISVTSLATLILFRFVRPTLLVSCMKALTTRGALRSRLNAMAFKELWSRKSIQQHESSGKMKMILFPLE
jgi:hypothetical protein